MRTAITALCDHKAWGEWMPLEGSWLGGRIPLCPGLYRILLWGSERGRMAYIGQSSNLRDRVRKLRHIYMPTSPLHEPHFAGPALWEWRQRTPEAFFEVSVAPFPAVPKPLRLGLECLAIALCQQEHDAAPLVNFGRTREEWCALWDSPDEHLTQEMRPLGPLDQFKPHERRWCGLNWSPWVLLSREGLPGEGLGLYRLRVRGCDPLLYIGQGEVADRLADRLKGNPSSLAVECSWAFGNWSTHRRLELKSYCIGAHLFSLSAIPLWQFERDVPPPLGPMTTTAAA